MASLLMATLIVLSAAGDKPTEKVPAKVQAYAASLLAERIKLSQAKISELQLAMRKAKSPAERKPLGAQLRDASAAQRKLQSMTADDPEISNVDIDTSQPILGSIGMLHPTTKLQVEVEWSPDATRRVDENLLLIGYHYAIWDVEAFKTRAEEIGRTFGTVESRVRALKAETLRLKARVVFFKTRWSGTRKYPPGEIVSLPRGYYEVFDKVSYALPTGEGMSEEVECFSVRLIDVRETNAELSTANLNAAAETSKRAHVAAQDSVSGGAVKGGAAKSGGSKGR